MNDNLVALFVMFFVFGFPVAAFIVTRVLKHQERMELLRRGIPPPDMGDKHAYRAWRQSGAPWPPPNAGVVPPTGWSAPEDDPQRALYRGIRTAFIGLAILIGLSFIGGTPGSTDFHGGPWLLGGLIPMFVGIAQVIIALLSGAQLPGVQGQTTFIPPPGPGPGSPPPPGFAGSGAPQPPPWADQPGRQRFEELAKPVKPPDLR
jgi:hypothetical protein